MPETRNSQDQVARDYADQYGDQFVGEARNHRPVPGHEAAIPCRRHIICRLGQDFRPRTSTADTRALGEFGRHRARTQYCDSYAEGFELAVQRFRE